MRRVVPLLIVLCLGFAPCAGFQGEAIAGESAPGDRGAGARQG